MIGAIIGDVVGSRFEFDNYKSKDFEMFDKECDFTIAVIAEKSVRINRITNRDNISIEAASARINAQLADEELIAKCDFTINNSGSIEELREQVRSLYNIIFKK